jgi:small subunit ribosomal protein S27e
MEYDLLHMPQHVEKRRHKLRRTVPAPNSYYLKVKCPTCKMDSVVFSHGQSACKCTKCNMVLCKPTGGKLKFINNATFNVIRKETDRKNKIQKSN